MRDVTTVGLQAGISTGVASRNEVWIPRRPPTPVFDAYWRFAAERQHIFRLRLRGAAPPFTTDPVLEKFKFTNAYRASDRTSQYLIRSVVYDRPRPWRDTFLRIVLFKLFNRIETWERLTEHVGEINADTFDVKLFQQVLGEAFKGGEKLYSAAYIIPPPQGFGGERKHENHMFLIDRMLREGLDRRVAAAPTMDAAYNALLQYPSIGTFLAYQLITDLAYAPDMELREDEFVVPGPGALDGIAKCFSDLGDFTPAETIRWAMESQETQFNSRGIVFEDLWARPLQLIDCQSLFCEIGKYARAAYPGAAGPSGRRRIKQRFRPRADQLSAWYPPKWGINETVKQWLRLFTPGPAARNTLGG